jgi:inorganic phosphate transporter, PiT family
VVITALLLVTTLFVAYANGANDNFKGVATLYGSNTASYRGAIALATVATIAGAVSSVYFAGALVDAFSGKGLVPDAVMAAPEFLLAVAAGAGSTVILATVRGLPISTTHALTGALAGAGFAAVGSQLNLAHLGSVFFAPLVLGPVCAVLLTIPLYRGLRALARRLNVRRESCICVSAREYVPVRRLQFDARLERYTIPAAVPAGMEVVVGTRQDCVERYRGKLLGISGQALVDGLHYFSAAMVSFARGLNDTPKIVGLLLVVEALRLEVGMLAIATAMAAGGLINARRVAITMSRKISRMNDGQALTANLATGLLVVLASRFGLPVSTTHVSVGAISGIGFANGSADQRVIGGILASWLLTLPVAAAIGALTYGLLGSFPSS